MINQGSKVDIVVCICFLKILFMILLLSVDGGGENELFYQKLVSQRLEYTLRNLNI